MNPNHGSSGNMGYNIMGQAQFGAIHHDLQEHPLMEAVNNSTIVMNMNIGMEDGDIDDERKIYDPHGEYEMNRNATEAIQNFVMPEGFVADYVPSWSKNRSIIFDCGVKATSAQSGKTIWFCLCSPQCQQKSAKGIGIAIKGAVTNCTNHLRDIHKIISQRSAKIIRRKPDNLDGMETNTTTASNNSNKKRTHNMLSSTRSNLTYTNENPTLQQQQQQHLAMLHINNNNVNTIYANMSHTGSSGTSSGSGTSNNATSTMNLNETWSQYFNKNQHIKYQIIAAPGMETMAETIVTMYPNRFLYHKTIWGKFPDGTDNIMIGGFQPVNRIAGENVLMLASFNNNSTTLTQLLVMVTLLQSFIESLTVVLPFYPVGTMERVSREGQVATASTYAQMISNLPNCGKPTRLVIYDLHTLQNRFYLHGNAIASMQTTIPLLIERLRSTHINCIAFPDDGSYKRFGYMLNTLGFEFVLCGKTSGEDGQRVVTIQDGQVYGKHVLVIDDLAQTGSTIYQCGIACTAAGASTVSAFLAHAVFPNHSWRSFLPEGKYYGCFDKFFVTNSVPNVTNLLPQGSVFEVLDLSRKIIEDLDRFS